MSRPPVVELSTSWTIFRRDKFHDFAVCLRLYGIIAETWSAICRIMIHVMLEDENYYSWTLWYRIWLKFLFNFEHCNTEHRSNFLSIKHGNKQHDLTSLRHMPSPRQQELPSDLVYPIWETEWDFGFAAMFDCLPPLSESTVIWQVCFQKG